MNKDAELQRLKNQLREVESELDFLRIDLRNAKLETERLKSNLTRSFSMLYEDWEEYIHSEATEENYESLQAIIKKMFRALERNGIDF